MNLRIDNANNKYKRYIDKELKTLGAVVDGPSTILPRLAAVAPELEIAKVMVDNERLYLSDGCRFFSEKNSTNRDEFVIHELDQQEEVSVEIMNLVCFFHVSRRSLKLTDVIQIGDNRKIPKRFSHVLISYPFFFPKCINEISIDGLNFNLSWILPISSVEYEFIRTHGADEFETRLSKSTYDFFDDRLDFDFLWDS